MSHPGLDEGAPHRALLVYEHGLRSGAARLVDRSGRPWPMAIPEWSGEAGGLDDPLVRRCSGPTLDVGCGPGRLTAALQQRGLVALGIDVSPLAVALTRARGVSALRRDVFTELPGERRWQHLLLADGNVGIGGDPLRLLARCRSLLEPAGTVLLDLAAPGSGLRTREVRLETEARTSEWFRWSWLGVDALEPVAAAAGLTVTGTWRADDGVSIARWQAELTPSTRWERSDRRPRQPSPREPSPQQPSQRSDR